MKLQPISLAIGAALLIAGCANVAQPTTVKAVSVEAVMRQVKKELAQYTAYQQARAAEKRASTVCKGNVDFAIDSVSISLVTQTDISVDGNASFSIPVAGAGTVGPSLAGSYGNTQTQTVNFTIFPVDGSQPPEATTKSDSLLRRSNMVSTMPWISSDGFKFARTRSIVLSSWLKPSSAKNSH